MLWTERVAPGRTLEDDRSVASGDLNLQLGHWLCRMHRDNFGLRRDGVADEDRRRELPVLTEKHRAGTRHVHRDQRVQQPSGQSTLYDEPTKLCGRGEFL